MRNSFFIKLSFCPDKHIINSENIIEVHDFVIDETGGHPGLRNRKDLETLLSQVNYPPDRDRKGSLVFVCAQILKSIIQNHPFVDGNKRTALGIVLTLLKRNNYKFKAPKKDIENLVWKIAKGEINQLDEIEYWIFSNIKMISKSRK